MGLNLVKKTYNHTFREHTTIILREMCSRVSADYNKIPFADPEANYYNLYKWR